MSLQLTPEARKGEVKRRNREQTRRFNKMKRLRAMVDWEMPVNRKVMEAWEDLACDSEDEELGAAMIHCIEVMKATGRERDAVINMERRLADLRTF